MLNTAITAAKEAGNFLVQNMNNLTPDKIEKKQLRDFVTEVDKQSEKIILDILQSEFPDHQIIAEESGLQRKNSDYRWIIDPLDGTTNYIHGYPCFAVSIGLEYAGEVVIGVVYNPYQNELFTAEKGYGAFLNGKPIKVAQHKKLESTMLATGFPFRNIQILDHYFDIFKELFISCAGIRRNGSAALDLCYVACGRFDGFWEFGLSPWDIAAGDIILQEAEGISSDFYGKNDYFVSGNIVSANPTLHNEMVKIIQKYM